MWIYIKQMNGILLSLITTKKDITKIRRVKEKGEEKKEREGLNDRGMSYIRYTLYISMSHYHSIWYTF